MISPDDLTKDRAATWRVIGTDPEQAEKDNCWLAPSVMSCLVAAGQQFCTVCYKPHVTIPQAVIMIQIDHFLWTGGEAVCWGRGDCMRAIVAAERKRRFSDCKRCGGANVYEYEANGTTLCAPCYHDGK